MCFVKQSDKEILNLELERNKMKANVYWHSFEEAAFNNKRWMEKVAARH